VRKPSEFAYEVETNFQYLWKSIFDGSVPNYSLSHLAKKKSTNRHLSRCVDELALFKDWNSWRGGEMKSKCM
jgi:hypothetical protein